MIRLRLLGSLDVIDSDGAELRAVLAQPKRLTLLAYLAVEPGVFRRRDTLLALFWPEADDAAARLALRQALHHLRRALGRDVLVARAVDEVGVAPGALWCDVAAFDAACKAGNHADALALVRGEFLAGIHVVGAGLDLEEWIATTRSTVRARAVGAARADAARVAATAPAEAAERLRSAQSLEPLDEGIARERFRLLVAAGDPAAALHAAAEFAARLDRELGVAPGPELRALVAGARAALTTAASAPASLPDVALPAVPAAGDEVPVRVPDRAPRAYGRRARPWRAILVGATALVVVVAGLRGRARPTATAIAPAARGLYDEGVRTLYERADAAAAVPLLQAALRADSTCAPCAYQAAIAVSARDQRVAPSPEMAVAARLAGTAAPADRLRIRYWVAKYQNVVARTALAESLLVLRPDDPESEADVGESLVHAGGYASALPHLRRVLALDSLGLRRGGPLCTACDAERELVVDYVLMDSLPAAEREAEAWVHQQPHAAAAWGALAQTFEREGRFEAARTAHARRVALQGGEANDRIDRAVLALRAGEFAEADGLLRPLANDDNAATRADALWYVVILRRDEGRLREALDVARQFAAVTASLDTTGTSGIALVPEAQVLVELGRWREAAARWRALARVDPAYARALPGEAARRRTWMLTQLATTLAAAGDTSSLAALADTIAREGARSAYGRDHVLHQYVRGLALERAGDRRSAEAAFRAAVLSPTEGYTRANVALAQLLMAEGRAAEVPAVVRPALAGSVEASNYYVTRTEMHECLARAFDATGQRDSAAAHWARVAAAWRNADPPLRARAAQARARVGARARG